MMEGLAANHRAQQLRLDVSDTIAGGDACHIRVRAIENAYQIGIIATSFYAEEWATEVRRAE
jgi:hypothetical protein